MNTRICLFLCLLFHCAITTQGQPPTALERSVVVEATLRGNGEQLTFNWLADPKASGYTVYKKSLNDKGWGTAIASLPGEATSWTDDAAQPGTASEYAFFKHEFSPVSWELCLTPSTLLRFEIQDMYGIGLCCSFGYGYYEVSGCDSLFAGGDDFNFAADHEFMLCDRPDSCVDLTVTIFPDIFPNSTSWTLFDATTNEVLGTSGPPGTYISPRPAYGFIYAGSELELPTYRGTILLAVDETVADSLQLELTQLHQDLVADGWHSVQINVSRDSSVVSVKEQIKAVYQNYPDLRSVYIIGHVPVPYSGDIYPDTHTEHRGAWAADSYYADLDGTWTDSIVDRSTAFFAYNHNVPGDGKLDQGGIPSPVELEIGRVDFYNMPAFAASEIELLRRYLRKASDYKHGRIPTIPRALIDDNFFAAFAAPAASGWRNFGPLVGLDSIYEADYFTAAGQAPYQWVYGCGPGTHISSAGIGSTTDFANDSLQSIFSMLFGSQFGDWDNVNNFLRAPIASGTTLTNCWAGNPPWTFHTMAMGEHIGACVRRTQNSENGVYLPGPQMVHVALMGDPTLRMHTIAGIDELTLQQVDQTVQLTWSPARDTSVMGYQVLRKDSLKERYDLIHAGVLEDTTFSDNQPLTGINHYLVKAVRLERTPSGTYYNTSLGLTDSLDVNIVISSYKDQLSKPIKIYPNPGRTHFYLEGLGQYQGGKLRMLNVQGQIVREIRLDKKAGVYWFSLQAVPAGIYWIEVQKGPDKRVEKVVVIK